MKILEDRYPLGSLPLQRTPGRYIDGILYDNLQTLASVIKEDMTFLGIISSSTLEVGTGKSVFVQQIGEAWIELVNKLHKENIPNIAISNLVFTPRDIVERAFNVPRYSILIVDEWEDAHYWSELAISLRQFFRKCRQLNLFIIIIIPNFFQLPIEYAVTRSVFFIDVKFENKFQRGFFRFFSFDKKKELYLQGKKRQDYGCIVPDFSGRFGKGYVVDEEEYRKAKLNDLAQLEKSKDKPITKREMELVREARIKVLTNLLKNCPDMSMNSIASTFDIDLNTLYKWRKKIISRIENQEPAHTIIDIPDEGDEIIQTEGPIPISNKKKGGLRLGITNERDDAY